MKHPHQFYMGLAESIGQASYCERNKVGALLVKNHNIIAFGYNGTPTGFDNCCELTVFKDEPGEDKPHVLITAKGPVKKTKPEVLHAESNAITKCARSTHSSEGSIMYCTFSPCPECAKLIIQAGIIRVIFKHYYRDQSGLTWLTQAGVKWQLITETILDV